MIFQNAQKTYKALNSRKYKRFFAEYLIKYEIVESGEGPFVSNLKDLSAGGLRFWTDRFIPEGTNLNLSVFVPPLQRILHALGRVQRIRRAQKSPVYYVSVGFVELPRADQEALNQFVENLSLEPGARFLIHHPEIVTRSQPTPD